MRRLSGSDGGSNPTEKQQVIGSTPVPTTDDDQGKSLVIRFPTPSGGVDHDREMPGAAVGPWLVARSSLADFLIRRLIRAVRPSPVEAFPHVDRPEPSVASQRHSTSRSTMGTPVAEAAVP